MATVCVIGGGYVGLPTAAVAADSGHSVTVFDVDMSKVISLQDGRSPISEPGLDDLVRTVVEGGRLRASSSVVPADVFIVAVPTPLRGIAYKNADLSFVRQAVASISQVLQKGNLVIVESTCPPGTTVGVVATDIREITGLDPEDDVDVAYCPERILPGRILIELVSNDRVVGGVTPAATSRAILFYRSFVRGTVLGTDATTAEFVKLIENTHRDVNIALVNEFSLVAEHLGVSVWEAIDLANRHPRVRLLRPGPGVGGHCIAVDPWFVVDAAPKYTRLIAAARGVNDTMPRHIADLVAAALGDLGGKIILCLGLTYKANVADTRESPSLEVIEHLRRAGAEVRTHDAVVAREQSIEALASGVDGLVLLVAHDEYRSIQPLPVGKLMRRRIIVDSCGALVVADWTTQGFDVRRLGDGRANGVGAGVRALTNRS